MDFVDIALGGVVAAVAGGLIAAWSQSRERRHKDRLLNLELEHQTREALRRRYGELLVTQRRSREASLRLAEAGKKADKALAADAVAAHAEFVDSYHELNLDSNRPMWLEARGLRDALGRTLELAQSGHLAGCRDAAGLARDARQNLERSFRQRLGHKPHQCRRNLREFDKVERPDRFWGAFTIFHTSDLARAVAFYTERLGFEERYRFRDAFVAVGLGELSLGLTAVEKLEPPGRASLWLYCKSVDVEIAALRQAGVEVVREPEDMEWGERMAAVRDPDGNVISLGQRAQ
jgi:lactoylglutathione lyase